MGVSENDLAEAIVRWEDLTKGGHAARVRSEILRLKPRKIPKHHRRMIANLLRRAGDYRLALKVLTPALFQSDMTFHADLKFADVAEYSAILLKVGMAGDALKMLATIENSGLPEVLLYEAFCYIGTWRSEAAIPLLEKYVTQSSVPDYARLAGRVNLLSCLIADNQFERAITMSAELIEACAEKQLKRLHGNCLELRGRALIASGQLAEARGPLQEALDLMRADTGRYNLHIQKWLVFLDCKNSGDPRPMTAIREQALNEGLFEIVREIDVLTLKVEFNPEIFARVLFGSRIEQFRRKILREFSQEQPLPAAKYFTAPDAPDQFDFREGELNGKAILAPGKKLHQVAYIMGTELYSRFSVGTLHSILYPDEHFNPWSSPMRVTQLLSRLNQELRPATPKLAVHNVEGLHTITATKDLGLAIPYEICVPASNDLLFSNLERKAKAWPLNSAQISNMLSLSPSSAKRFIRDCIEKERLVTAGEGARTVYLLKAG